jgi:hypothetical protein
MPDTHPHYLEAHINACKMVKPSYIQRILFGELAAMQRMKLP